VSSEAAGGGASEGRPARKRTRADGRALSALEEALRRALEESAPEEVRQRVSAIFPEISVRIETGSGSGFHGRVKKVSVSMPEDLVERVRERTGPGGFSQYVTEAVEERVRLEGMQELLDEFEAEAGPIPAELVEEAKRIWFGED
jgi:hypothetical protein